MLNHQLIKVDAEGRLRTTLELPLTEEDFNGGTPTRDGLLCIVDVDGLYFVNGLGYGQQQRICRSQQPDDSENPLADSRGRLRASTMSPAFWLYGLPFGADGRMSLADPEGPPPVDSGAFSNAYSNAFDV